MLEVLTIKRVIACLLLLYGVLGLSKAFDMINKVELKAINRKNVKEYKKEIKELKEQIKKMEKEKADA